MSGLIPVCEIKSLLRYHQQGLNGAIDVAYLSSLALPSLVRAAQWLERQSPPDRRIELLIWDAYRTPEAQKALYDRYVQELLATEGLTLEAATGRARGFVALPTAVFPHGTGGAVDVTLLINGEEAAMGTGFDDFVPQAASDWYQQNPPLTEADQVASDNREMLRTAMLTAGFIGLDSEWWHFEWGTRRWADATGNSPLLTAVLPVPA